MSRYALSHRSDQALLRDLQSLVARDRATTAELLAHLAEVDERRLYLPAAYPSMYAYCVGKLGFCEQSAFKRIRAARAAQRFPAIYRAIAEGRLHLSAVVRLATHLTPENAAELLDAAAHKSLAELERLLAGRFPQPDLPTRLEAIPGTSVWQQLSSRTVVSDERGSLEPSSVTVDADQAGGLAPVAACLQAAVARGVDGVLEPAVGIANPGQQHAPGHVSLSMAKLAPLSPERYALQVTLPQSTHDKLVQARALLGHAVPSGDLAEVLDRALEALIEKLERRKCAAASRPRATAARRSGDPRHIPAAVKRAVWTRDGGRCTFVSDGGHRCGERARLEFDHIEPVARGGLATVAGLRLRCRAHNQYEAERVFGAGFMEQKRRGRAREAGVAAAAVGARVAVATAGARVAVTAAGACSASPADPPPPDVAEDVLPWLRALGVRADEARLAIARSGAAPDAPLETRVRLALRGLGPPRRRPAA